MTEKENQSDSWKLGFLEAALISILLVCSKSSGTYDIAKQALERIGIQFDERK